MNTVSGQMVFHGISPSRFQENLKFWMENPYWKEYYEGAPSELCRAFIGLEFYFSFYDTDASVKAMRKVEKSLTLEDWQYLYQYCGNNPRKTIIRKKIMELSRKDEE